MGETQQRFVTPIPFVVVTRGEEETRFDFRHASRSPLVQELTDEAERVEELQPEQPSRSSGPTRLASSGPFVGLGTMAREPARRKADKGRDRGDLTLWHLGHLPAYVYRFEGPAASRLAGRGVATAGIWVWDGHRAWRTGGFDDDGVRSLVSARTSGRRIHRGYRDHKERSHQDRRV